MKTSNKFFIIVLLLIFHGISQAQLVSDEQKVRSIIYTEYDTIKCFLDYQESFDKNIRYKTYDGSSSKINIEKVIKIKKGPNLYKKVNLKNKVVLMRIIKEGVISLYEYSKNRDLYAFDQVGSTPNDISKHRKVANYSKSIYYIEKNGVLYKMKGNVKKRLKKLMPDNEEVSVLIEDFDKALIRFKLKRIVSKYNYELKYQ